MKYEMRVPADGEEYVVFTERMYLAMRRRKMTQGQLAERLGMDRGTITAWRKSKYRISLRSAVLVARALGVSMDWLCGLCNVGGPP